MQKLGANTHARRGCVRLFTVVGELPGENARKRARVSVDVWRLAMAVSLVASASFSACSSWAQAPTSEREWVWLVRRKIEIAKVIPPSMYERYESGAIRVKFAVDASGRLVSNRIVKPSCYDNLNAAALDSIRRAAPCLSLSGFNARKAERVLHYDHILFRASAGRRAGLAATPGLFDELRSRAATLYDGKSGHHSRCGSCKVYSVTAGHPEVSWHASTTRAAFGSLREKGSGKTPL